MIANISFASLRPTGSHPHRRNESDLFGWRDANPPGEFVQRQQSARRLAEHVPQSKCQRSDFGAAAGLGAWPGQHFHRPVEQRVLQNAQQIVVGVKWAE